MKKLLKLNPQYPISIGLVLMGVGGIFFDTTDDIGLVITLSGCFILFTGAIIVLFKEKKR